VYFFTELAYYFAKQCSISGQC